MENKGKKACSFLLQHRQSAPEGEKFYFRLVGGEHVVAHKWIIEEATTTLTLRNEVVVPKDIERANIEAFVKFLYLEELVVDQMMSLQDMPMIVRLCQLLSLKKHLRKKLYECIQPAMNKRLEEDLLGTNEAAHGGSGSQETNFNNENENDGVAIAEENQNQNPMGGGDEEENGDCNYNNNQLSSNDQTTRNMDEGGSSSSPTEPAPGSEHNNLGAEGNENIQQSDNEMNRTHARSRAQSASREPRNRIQSDRQDHRRRKEPSTYETARRGLQPSKKAKNSHRKNTEEIDILERIENAVDNESISLEPREYSLSEILLISRDGVTIEGSGSKTVFKHVKRSHHNQVLFHLFGNRITIRNLTIRFNDVNWTTKSKARLRACWGVYIQGSNCIVENVRIENGGIILVQHRNVLRNLDLFYAKKGIGQAIRITGHYDKPISLTIPGGENELEDIRIRNYKTGISIYGSQQTGNKISNISFKDVHNGVTIEASRNNQLNDLKYECPPYSVNLRKQEKECCALRIYSGAKNNKVDDLHCSGFQKGMKIRSIFIGRDDANDALPEGNIVKNWTGEGLLPPMLCDEGNNRISDEGEKCD